jgi:hypothetical protein
MDPDSIPSVAAGMAAPHSLEPTSGPLTFEELQLAGRNRGMPLEALPRPPPRASTTCWSTGTSPIWRPRRGTCASTDLQRSLELTLADLQARPTRMLRVTLNALGTGEPA